MPPAREPPRQNTGRRRRLTLPELLVVVAVVAIVAGLLFSPFSGPREKFRLARCCGNLKDLAFGLRTYAADHDGRFPPANGWATAVMPHVRGADVFACPGDDSRRFWHGGGPYAMSRRLSAVRPRGIRDPAAEPLLWDAAADGQAARRHGGGLAFGFADGHAKWLPNPPPDLSPGVLGLPD
jgi:prepilin-type processing-associated H-X9-DG protein